MSSLEEQWDSLFEKGDTPFTKEEVRQKFVEHVAQMAKYWSEIETDQNRCEGVAFSILAAIDGASMGLPSFDMIPTPHEDDKAYHQKRGERWYEPIVINDDAQLHEMFHPIMDKVNGEEEEDGS